MRSTQPTTIGRNLFNNTCPIATMVTWYITKTPNILERIILSNRQKVILYMINLNSLPCYYTYYLSIRKINVIENVERNSKNEC